jgi:3-methyladenine DNA glycosylase/8-oxoguanine DNA glycosylase
MSPTPSWSGARVFTIGHSTRTLDELVALLRSFEVAVVADIRTIPRSRRNPQFNADALRAELPRHALRYAHLPGLGGLRHPRKDSPNTGWRNASFRGFADYMQTEGFERGLEELRALAAQATVALMCAEAVPWRCHRSLVADALTARGARVEHITGAARSTPHRLTPFAHVEGGRVDYPGEAGGAAEALATRAPFHLEATVRVLQRRPANPVDVWEDGAYWRVLEGPEGLALVEVRDRGSVDAPDLQLAIRGARAPAPLVRAALQQSVRRVLGLDVDPAPLARRVESVVALRATARALRGLRPPRFAGLFEAFANVVPFQQLSLDAGVATVARLVERFGEGLEHGGRRFHAFPAARVIAHARPAALRACGLSTRKAEALRALARAIAAGELSEAALERLSTPQALRALQALPGIGPWSAALVLLRGLGRLDAFPPGDVGAQRALGALTRLAPAALERLPGRFGDQRGYLYFYGLGASLLARGLIHAAPAAWPSRRPLG